MQSERIFQINKGEPTGGPVVYWMSRDQRVEDNWALIFAFQQAKKFRSQVIIVFNLVPAFLEATERQYLFMLKGLQEVEKRCQEKHIPFYMLTGQPEATIPAFIHKTNASELITDFDPLKIKRIWKESVREKIQIPFYEVDAHNIVPCRIASDKPEFAAYTLRPKIQKKLSTFLENFPPVPAQQNGQGHAHRNDWSTLFGSVHVEQEVKEVGGITPGSQAARQRMQHFIENTLPRYGEKRNDPNAFAVSNLSPYLHFGQLAAQRVVIDIIKSRIEEEQSNVFLDEIIVRKELSDNFCHYNHHYDAFEAFPPWAQKTLNDHRNDEREYVYAAEEFEYSQTHDPLWNAAQQEMVKSGKMHGYLRMYWAKKILEWTTSPEDALQIAITLNDKYQLDGRDPNGYAGCAWSIGGVHDRAWTERNVYGKIRYMNDKGARRKFDVNGYIQRIRDL